jgi:hypothetical protein
VKRAPEIFAARSKSRIPSSGPRSQWALGTKSSFLGSHAPDLAVGLRVAAHGHAVVGQVRHEQHEVAKPCLGLVEPLLELLDPVGHALHLGLEGGGVPSTLPEPRDLLASEALTVPELLDFLQRLAPLDHEVEVQTDGLPSSAELLDHRLPVLDHVLQVQQLPLRSRAG